VVFHNPFSVFGRSFEAFNEIWQDIFRPGPITPSKIWRYTTVERLAELVGHDTIKIGEYPKESASSALADSIIQARTDAVSAIWTGLELISSTVDVSQIRHVVDKAFGLSLQMSLQRCRVQATFVKEQCPT